LLQHVDQKCVMNHYVVAEYGRMSMMKFIT